MSFPLSSNIILPLSSYVEDLSVNYMNVNRLFSDNYTLSTIDNIDYRQYDSLTNIKDIAINDHAIVFLTNQRTLSSVINNIKTLSSLMVGFSGVDVFSQYFWNLEYIEKNPTLDIKNSFDIKSNYLLTIPFKTSSNYNIIPLKSSQGIDGEYDFNEVKKASTARQYDAIYLDNRNNLFCQFRTSGFPVEIKDDEYNVIFIPAGIPSSSINNLNFENFGANWGNMPSNSDVILLDKFGYSDYTNSGFVYNDVTFNGLPLCLWLSGNSANGDADVVWMERWYDPNNITQGDAFIAQVNTTSAINPIIDKPSSESIYEKNKLSYLRFGKNRNITYINNLSSTLQLYLSSWGNIIEDEANGIKGFAIPAVSPELYPVAKFDGSLHFHIPPDEKLIIEDNMTVGLWVYQDRWDCGIDTQYFGNFFDDSGYGLSFNTGANSELLTLPSTSGFVYGFNNKGYRVFEKSVNASLDLTASRIDYIVTDLNGFKWMYDSVNHNIYKMSTDNLLTELIPLESTASISKMQVNSANELYVLDTTQQNISGFDVNGNYKYGPTAITVYNNFEIDLDDNVTLKTADIMLTDNNNSSIVALGINIYKDNVLLYNIGHKILAMNIDLDNNIWVAYDTNKLLKLDNDGELLWSVVLPVPFTSEDSIELNFVKGIKRGCDEDYMWMVFNTNNYIIKLDSNGTIIKRISVLDVINLKKCGALTLNVHGDFSGFEARRKFNRFSDGIHISSDDPALSLNINVKCGTNTYIVKLHTPTKELTGWNHIAFTHQIIGDETHITLYVNGIVKETSILNGIYFVNYGSKITPFIIGGKSGKLGATNIEVGINNEQYFIGKINDVRVYNSVLDLFQLRGLASNLYYDGWQNMNWYMPTPERTYMEEIAGYHLHSYKGSKSNKYNIKIKNMQITDGNTQNIISDAIKNSIKKFTPINTELNEIIFE